MARGEGRCGSPGDELRRAESGVEPGGAPKVPLTSDERARLTLRLAELAGKQGRGEPPEAFHELLRQTPEEILNDPEIRIALRLDEFEAEELSQEENPDYAEMLLEPAFGAEYFRLPLEKEGERAYDLEQMLPDGTTPRECLQRFDPRRANLPEVTAEEAERYLLEKQDERPWLKSALNGVAEVKRVFVSLDRGHGHALARHEGYADDEMQSRRVRYLEDPAQLDAVERTRGIDGIKAGNKSHVCAEYATRINEPNAFAVAFVRGLEHPKVDNALTARCEPGAGPAQVSTPIVDLLGPEGYHSCSGYRLVGDDPTNARRDRHAWLAARADGTPTVVAEPIAERIQSMEGWRVTFRFRPNHSRTGYEVSTMFISPPNEIAK